ncbi:MAG: c-type cytochrome domain-containing protein [Anaerolineales bacterium]|nr:MAG: c-type cytochrome domain-containing protein [Anaerolineales bacterium]
MKFLKIILGLVAAGALLAGGFMAGTFITQTRAASFPAQQFAQPTFIPQQQYQPTIVPQQQIQPTVVPQQFQATPVPQTTLPAVPPQGQWGPGWWMDPNYTPQGQQGWGMRDWDYDNCGESHGGMMNGNGYGSQANPNWNSTPTVSNGSPYYPTPSTPVSFRNNVQPIFVARCIACHGATNGLYLDTYENVMRGGVNGAVVTPGDVYNSRLAYYVYTGYMPFRSTPLTPVEIQTILDWIAAGAPNN